MAAVPDFGALAGQQANASNQAAYNTNLANRPNQTNALGSITWGANPDGTWGQQTSLNAPTQGLFDTTMSGQTGLAGQIGQGVNFGSLPAMPTVGGYNQQVIDSWNALAKPSVDQASAAQRARAAAMGLTIGSAASNDIERNIGTNEATQRNQAILQGYQQGNTEFGQALSARQQAEKEALDKYTGAISGSSALTGIRQSLDPNSWASKVPASAAYVPQNIYGAALDTFSANQANENAAQAQSNANRAATGGLINTGVSALGALGGYKGISSLGSDLWGGAKNLWNWASGGGDTSIGGDNTTGNWLQYGVGAD